MRINNKQPNRLIGALIGAVAAISIALPATAGASPATEPAQFGAASTNHAQLASSNDFVLRRDGSKAVPFVADLGPKAPATAGGFDWGDAAIGAGAVTGVDRARAGRRPRRPQAQGEPAPSPDASRD